MRLTLIVALGAVTLLGWDTYGWKYYARFKIKPVTVGQPFAQRLVEVEDGRRFTPTWRRRSCTLLYVLDAGCAGCRAAAEHSSGRKSPWSEPIWLSVNTQAESLSFAGLFSRAPEHFVMLKRDSRLGTRTVLALMGIEATPVTIVVDSVGTVRDVLIGLEGAARCGVSMGTRNAKAVS